MVNSMTAYARAESRSEQYEAAAEIRSYNSKNLDIALHMARPYLPLEERIKAAVGAHIHRGRVELRIDIKVLKDDEQSFDIDWARAGPTVEPSRSCRTRFIFPGTSPSTC